MSDTGGSRDLVLIEDQSKLRRLISWFVPAEVQPTSDEDLSFMNPGAVIRAGYLVLIVALMAIGFASFTPLDSAIVASGEIIVKTRRKTIQHLEGGTVRQILVADGQKVKAGQVLIRLDDVLAKSNLSLLQGEADALTAQKARLEAERDGKPRISFPAELLARGSDPTAAAAMAGEVSAFQARSSSSGQQIGILGQRSLESNRMIEGLRAERASVQRQAALIRQELSGVEGLYAQGYVPVTRLLALKRQAADLDGQDGQLAGRIAQTQEGIGENQMQSVSLRGQKLSDVVKDLRDVETRRFDTLDRLHAAQATFLHTSLRAPADGIVVGLQVHSGGAVIKPGETVMEIVPDNDVMEVQARIRPEDAEYIHAGLPARINFSSYRQRRLPIITGSVETISADRLVDERGVAYFSAVVAVDAKGLAGYPEGRLIPGMPAEIEVNTGTRTPMSYLMAPITTVLRRGMREQ